ncbi:uncharacterized protein TrAtP1_002235 [Trichoderma atroviride]|nr:hypothetical protein TrAtP1_002235 [Trichoderma atroviride]
MVAYLRLLPFLGLLLADVTGVAAQGVQGVSKGQKWTKESQSFFVPGAYIVEFEDENDENALFGDLHRHGFSATKRLSINSTIFKGASFQLDSINLDPFSTAARIASVPSVKQAWPVHLLKRPDNATLTAPSSDSSHSDEVANIIRRAKSANDTYSPHVAVQIDKLHNAGITGKGIKIGIIDTGVDFNHPALGGCFGKGCVVTYGTDLVGDDYDGSNTPVPGPEPYANCTGHGTHVTGIIGALSNPVGIIGAAPGAEIGMYRVFGCTGDVGADVAMAGATQAFEDGSDILSLSLGGASGWTEDSFSVLLQRIVDAGVPVAVANGNSGSAGLFTAGTPANGKGVTAVSSVENTMTPYYGTIGYVNTDKTSTAGQLPFVYANGANPLPNTTLPLFAITPNVTTDGTFASCNPLNSNAPADLSGYIVLVQYTLGPCDTWTVAEFLAKNNNAKNILYWLDAPGHTYAPGSDAAGFGMTTQLQGQIWIDQLDGGKELYLTFFDSESAPTGSSFLPNPTNPNTIDTFTSWGPTWQADVNPSISTVGGSILSTYPVWAGSYAVDSGTSMATPLMASIYALLMEARGTKDPKTLLNVLSSTALQLPFYDGTTLYNELAPVAQQGGGLAQAYDAAHATTLLSVSSISFNDTDNFVKKTNFEIKNTGKRSVTYTIGHNPTLTMYTFGDGSTGHYSAPFPNPIADGAAASLAFSQKKITVPAGGSAAVTVVATPPHGLNATEIPVYSGFITLNATSGENLAIPYLGVVGSLAKLPVLDTDFNYMIRETVFVLDPVPANYTYVVPVPTSTVWNETLVPLPDYPAILLQIDAGSPLFRVDLVAVGDTKAKVNTTSVLGADIVGTLPGFPIPFAPKGEWIVAYTGMTQEGIATPAGTYQFLVRAAKVYGDVNNPKDFESMLTQPFNMAYNWTADATSR